MKVREKKIVKKFRIRPSLVKRMEHHAKKEQVTMTSIVEDGISRLLK